MDVFLVDHKTWMLYDMITQYQKKFEKAGDTQDMDVFWLITRHGCDMTD